MLGTLGHNELRAGIITLSTRSDKVADSVEIARRSNEIMR